ncbi:hypothetical protein Q5752_006744 [Cryptotrichosporon argae]
MTVSTQSRGVHHASPGAAVPPRIQSRLRLNGEFDADDLETFAKICGQATRAEDYPLSDAVHKKVVVYRGDTLRREIAASAERRDAVMAELHQCLLHGPGVFAVTGCVRDPGVLDRASAAFRAIIAREKETSGARGDHFAPAGNNDRIWNSFQKHAEADPANFVDYYANEVLDAVFEAWLGPNYRVTAQANVVKPGGKAQLPHRDYHLGFQSEAVAARFPIAAQIASQLLTLQGAVAHSDMPLNSGPTQLLPFSQHFDYGYTAYRKPAFARIFHDNMVQLELAKGDAVFFNPALFHAAGDNTTADVERTANLLQISACWGKPMESVDSRAILAKTWPHVAELAARVGHDSLPLNAVLRAVCDAYSFPTNLDRDPPPASGHCPPTELDRAADALAGGQSVEQLLDAIDAYQETRLP